jgi:hypothetical protein
MCSYVDSADQCVSSQGNMQDTERSLHDGLAERLAPLNGLFLFRFMVYRREASSRDLRTSRQWFVHEMGLGRPCSFLIGHLRSFYVPAWQARFAKAGHTPTELHPDMIAVTAGQSVEVQAQLDTHGDARDRWSPALHREQSPETAVIF